MRILTLICLLPLVFGLTACSSEDPESPAINRMIPLSKQFTGEFSLVDQTGAAVTQNDFGDKLRLIYFGFTHCPDVCPGDVIVMRAALDELGARAEAFAPIFITVDPERDTPEALAAYFSVDERVIALTGDMRAAQEAWASFKVVAQRRDLPGSALEYEVQHTRFYYIADENGQPRFAVPGGVNPQELADILRRSIKLLS